MVGFTEVGSGAMIEEQQASEESILRLLIQEALNQCVVEAGADIAFLATPPSSRKGRPMSIVAAYPAGEPSTRLLAPWVCKGVLRAFESEETTLAIDRQRDTRQHQQPAALLIATPTMNARGEVLGALGAISLSNERGWAAISVVERLANEMTGAFESPHATRHEARTVHTSIPLVQLKQPSEFRDDVLRHEVRVPLSAANFALEALARRHAIDWTAEDQRLLHTAQFSLIEAQGLLRASSQLQAMPSILRERQLQPVKLPEILERALTLFPFAHERIQKDIAEALPLVWADEQWLVHVLTNVIENAIKYSWPSTPITIAVRESEMGKLNTTVFSRGREFRADCDTPRSRTHDAATSPDLGNRGLGLTIAKRLVTAMDGDIWIESDNANGTSAIVSLRTVYA